MNDISPISLGAAAGKLASNAADAPWWRGAAIYQIYPRSFADSNGDGIGDLPGITAHLDHVAQLGVDAIWISPFFTSPMADFGYDVADYCNVDPIFGTLADFDALVARAHGLGLKVIIDVVFSHTSDQHPWFADSRANGQSAHADWFVWADAKPDGTPPNNWQSVFGGPAWTWDARRGQYYYHQFLKDQPQLNHHNPAVQEAMLGVLRFWLGRGVDGFRLDALNHAMFDPELRDNPAAPANGEKRSRPYDFQCKTMSMSHPGVVALTERIRAVCDEYGAIFTVAEVGGAEAIGEMKAFTAGDARLSSAYGFEFLYAERLTPALVATTMAAWPGGMGADGWAEGWPSWAFENHDAPRAVSRWTPPGTDEAGRGRYARMLLALLVALRGNIFIYQGQELGLEQDDIPFHLLQDPEAITNWPLTLARDGVRTPMPWDSLLPNGGFTLGEPWLPLSAANCARAARQQRDDAHSLYRFLRDLLGLRQTNAPLRLGDVRDVHVDGAHLSFVRVFHGEQVECHFNLGNAEIPTPKTRGRTLLTVNGAGTTTLPGWAAAFFHGIAKV